MPKSPMLQQADLWQIDHGLAEMRAGMLSADRLSIDEVIFPVSPRKFRGSGLTLAYGFHASPFGDVVLIGEERGLLGLGFVIGQDHSGALRDMQERWPAASFEHRPSQTEPFAQHVFAPLSHSPEDKLKLVLLGSAFEIMVWKGLLSIPAGQTSTYSALSAHLGRPQAARAIGSAIGRNPLALLIPCHRVVGRNGALTGYHWGLACKQALLDWESGAAQLRD